MIVIFTVHYNKLIFSNSEFSQWNVKLSILMALSILVQQLKIPGNGSPVGNDPFQRELRVRIYNDSQIR